MKVRAKCVYIYHACVLDAIDARTKLTNGTRVRVMNLHGCPKCNTMGHAHVVHPDTGVFIGLVSTASLFRQTDYAGILYRMNAEAEANKATKAS